MKRFIIIILSIFLCSGCIGLGSEQDNPNIQLVSSVVVEEIIPEDIIEEEEIFYEELENETNEENQEVPLNLEEESMIIEEQMTLVPEEVEVSLKYNKYFINYDYIVLTKGEVNVREAPGMQGRVIKVARTYEKLNLLETVKGEYIEKYGSDAWHHVYWWVGEEKKFGFILAPLVQARKFQFSKMYDEIRKMEGEINTKQITFVNNYKNRVGVAPRYKGGEKDAYGNRRSQSAPGYFSLSNKEAFIYVEDGSLVRILSEIDNYYKVLVLNNNLQCWIPKAYIKNSLRLSELKKVIVIDRNNQNEGVFEKINNKWVLVSYTLATTGATSKYKIETPLGYYYALERKEKFIYLDDETKEVAGYAPYAVRFTGGTYIHGIPVNYKIKENKKIDPGHIEYTATIGTAPLSHRCVRNYTSHAKFIYNWVEIGKTIVIVIE